MGVRGIILGAALAASIGSVSAGHAAPIPTLFGTGLDAAGNPLAGGASDPHYTVIESGTAAVVRIGHPYVANDANSQWIWQSAEGFPENVARTFRTTFDLTGFDLSTVDIDGLWGTDNQGLDILLNGVSTGITLLGVSINNFNQLHAFSITSGFVSGINTLDFVVQDNGGPSGFRAQLGGGGERTSSDIPEPASLAVLGLGLAGLGLLRRRGARTGAA